MRYHQKEITLNHSLSFWNHFHGEERFFFYNPLTDECVQGAKRLKAVSVDEELTDYPYIFSTMTFFDWIKGDKWSKFGNEQVVFEYYLVEKQGKQILYYLDELIDIVDQDVVEHQHHYQYDMDDYDAWKGMFSAVSQAIRNQEVNKAVLSREVAVTCEENIHIDSMIQRLLHHNINSFIFAYGKGKKAFVGATPEILVQKEGTEILSYALAGTISRSEQDDERQQQVLLQDEKNLHEHQIVIDAIVEQMKKFTDQVTTGKTKLLPLKHLYHLKTCIYGNDEQHSLVEWAKVLHPTPALGGSPADKALPLIRQCEEHERGLYAAPIGLINGNGDGVFVVGIRSALIEENIAYAYAGCGIVEQSDCEQEYVETKNKLKTILDSL